LIDTEHREIRLYKPFYSGSIASLALGSTLLLSACATQPLAPTVQVFPAPNKPFEVFQGEQAQCEQYANQQVAGRADAANQRGLGEAVLTTALGAGLGAAVGGGRGAAVGAAAGGIVGADVGSNSSSHDDRSIQHQYNMVYSQCMYSKGDQVVGYAPRTYAPPAPVYYPQQPAYAPPPYAPPPGYPQPGYYPPPQ